MADGQQDPKPSKKQKRVAFAEEESMASRLGEDGQQNPKPSKKQKKVAFAEDVGLEPNDCITLYLVSSREEMDVGPPAKTNAQFFSPDFAERFFGEDGKIFGYKDLKINIWLHALSFHAFVDIKYSEKVQNAKNGKMTDLQLIFKDIFKTGLIEDRETFIHNLSSNYVTISKALHHHGEAMVSWRVLEDCEPGIARGTAEIEKKVLRLDLTSSEIREWHARLMPLALMFIEAGKPIQQDDPRWEVYITIQRLLLSENENPWKLTGFCTVYQFYHYPESTRLRISQILVFPPYQGMQNGLRLLEAVNATALERQCYDVTMEEPSESLQELRDCMDVLRLLSFEPVRFAVKKVFANFLGSKEAHDQTWLEPPAVLAEEIREKLKMSKMQFRRCWEILLFMHLKDYDTDAYDALRSLLLWHLKVELFGKAGKCKSGYGKLVIDTENKYDSSKTFVMAKVKQKKDDSDLADKIQGPVQDCVEINGRTDHENDLQEILSERIAEIERVVGKVHSHCRTLGILMISAS